MTQGISIYELPPFGAVDLPLLLHLASTFCPTLCFVVFWACTWYSRSGFCSPTDEDRCIKEVITFPYPGASNNKHTHPRFRVLA
ncbi:hypothetical protein PAL_GLEAN10007061 [Pteropus alecto]|uniref:Uncharacterized protein n=1 Tax=Pteropus alecto TaxID=9402 RepID=L5KYX1_PTEAL|nr:hypothetical protein PAL_GLEAN10007061 [Pteropus alecto]